MAQIIKKVADPCSAAKGFAHVPNKQKDLWFDPWRRHKSLWGRVRKDT